MQPDEQGDALDRYYEECLRLIASIEASARDFAQRQEIRELESIYALPAYEEGEE